MRDGNTKLISFSPYDITFVIARATNKDVPFEVGDADETKEEPSNELVAVTSVGKLRIAEESTSSPELGTPLELSRVENVESVIDEDETFALGTRVTKLAEDPGVSALLDGILEELEDEKLEVRLRLNEEASGGARGRDEMNLVVDKGVDELRLFVEKLAGSDDTAL